MIKNKTAKYLLFIILASVLPYINSLQTSFQLDDLHTIKKNKTIEVFDKYLDINSWKGLTYNRKIAELTYSVNYFLGGYKVFGYHLFNILVHIINSLLVFVIVRKLFLTTVYNSSRLKKHSMVISLFSALIFAVHPVQVQAVTYITQRMVSLATMFYLFATLSYIKGRLHGGKKSILFFSLTLLSFFLGIYCKEIIYSLPLALITIEFFFTRYQPDKINNRYLESLVVITLVAAFLFFLKFGFPRQNDAPTHIIYFLTQLHVLTIYIRLLFIPIGQHLYYLVPVAESLFDWRVVVGIMVITVLLFIAVKTYKKNRLCSFGIIWFFISLAVESSFFPLKYLLFEYRLYPAVFGFSIAFVSTLYFFINNLSEKVIIGFLTFVIIVFAFLTFEHNKVWMDPITLWTNNVIQSPTNKEAHKNLGIELMLQGRMKEAFDSFTTSIKLDSNYAESYGHRAVILSEHPSFESALKDANKAIELDTTKELYFNNRGYVYQSIRDYDNAIIDFRKAIKMNPNYDNAIKNLSVVLYFENKINEALLLANKSIELDSTREDYFNNRGNIYFALNDYDNAEKDFIKALSISPSYAKALNNIGVIKLRQNKIDEAIPFFTKTIQLDDRFLDAYYYRGYSLLLKGMKDLAYQDLRKCLLITPDHPGAMSLLNRFFHIKSK